MLQNNCRVENFNGLRFYEKDVLYDNYVFTEDIQITLDVTYLVPGFGIVLVDNEGYSIKERNSAYLFKIGYKEASIYYSYGQEASLEKQITCMPATTIQENMILTFIKKGKRIILKINDEIVFDEYLNKTMDKYTIGYYSNAGNVINNISIAANVPDSWIINMKNTQGGYIKFLSDSFELKNCKNNAEIEQTKIQLKAGQYFLNVETEELDSINDIKCYVYKHDDERLFDDEKNILKSNMSFILLEDTAINLKFVGKQGAVSNIMISSNKDDFYIPTTSDNLIFNGSSIDVYVQNLDRITWKGSVLRTPKNKYNQDVLYSLIMDNQLNIKPEETPIKLGEENFYNYEFNINDYTFYIYNNNEMIFNKKLVNISNKITIFKNIDAFISQIILYKKNGDVLNLNLQDENTKYINADIKSPILVLDQYDSPLDLSSSYRKSIMNNNSCRYIFTNWEREYFYPSQRLKLTNKVLRKEESVIIYGIKNNVDLDKIYDIPNDNINSIDLLSNEYDYIPEQDVLYMDKFEGNIHLKDNHVSKYKMFIVDYLKDDSYCLNYDYHKNSYVVNISSLRDKTKILYNSSLTTDKSIQINDYKITNINENINGYIVLRKGSDS